MKSKRRPKRIASRPWRIARYALAFVIVAYLFGFYYFLQALSHGKADRKTHTEAAIVLTGGSGRIAEGIDLLQTHMAGQLFISGVNPETDKAELARLTGQSAIMFRCCVTMGYQATNTVGNASESAEWVANYNYKSVRLVTSNYHMPRALLEFRAALPGVTIIPDAVIAKPSPGLHPRLILEYSKYLIVLAQFEFQAARRLLPA